MRRDPKGLPLPKRMHWKHGRYWYVRANKWRALPKDYYHAHAEMVRIESASEDWLELVKQVYERYEYKHKAGELAANTLKQYRGIRSKIEHAFGEFQVNEITTADVTTFLLLYENTPNIGNRMLSVVRAILDRGVALGWCPSNPARGVKRNDEKKRTRYLSDDEYRRIWLAGSPTMRAIMDMCYLTGQRIGDVIGIRHSDILPEGIVFTQQKTGNKILIERTPDIEAAISDAKRLHKVMALWLFHPANKAKPYTYTAIRDQWRRACEKANVEGATIHDIRAKSLTDADKDGLDATVLAGHKSKAMTERYLRQRKTMVARGPNLRHLLDARQSAK